jgi:hypothetical protein
MTSNDCGHAISMITICEKPNPVATNTRKHLAGYNASRPFTSVILRPEPKAVPQVDLPILSASDGPRSASRPKSPNQIRCARVPGFSSDRLRLSQALSIMREAQARFSQVRPIERRCCRNPTQCRCPEFSGTEGLPHRLRTGDVGCKARRSNGRRQIGSEQGG